MKHMWMAIAFILSGMGVHAEDLRTLEERITRLETQLMVCVQPLINMMRANILAGVELDQVYEFKRMKQATRSEAMAKIAFGEELLKGFADAAAAGRITLSTLGALSGAALIVAGGFIPNPVYRSDYPGYLFFITAGMYLLQLGAKFVVIGTGVGLGVISVIGFAAPGERERAWTGYAQWLDVQGVKPTVSVTPFIDAVPSGVAYGIRVSF